MAVEETTMSMLSTSEPMLAVAGMIGGLLLILTLLICVCKDNKTGDSTSNGFLHYKRWSLSVRSQRNSSQFSNGNVGSGLDSESNNMKTVPTLQRKLPDIPVLPVSLIEDPADQNISSQSPDTGSELYATVDTNNAHLNVHAPESESTYISNSMLLAETNRGPPSPVAPSPMGIAPEDVFASPITSALASVAKELREATPSSGDSDLEHPYAHLQNRKMKPEHPYDKLRGQTSEERDTDTDNYDDPQIYAHTTAPALRDWRSQNSNAYEPPPPVPEKRFDVADGRDGGGSTASSPTTPTALTAANAVSGRVPTTEIPYVTSPLESPTGGPSYLEPSPASVASDPHSPAGPHNPVGPPVVEPLYNISQTSSNGQEVRYTSISVREPLASLRAQLQSDDARVVVQPVTESYYSIVPEDDGDQTYAEIESGHTSGRSSVSYVRMEAGDPSRKLPPVPPTVESLRYLAGDHSRQSSTSSSIISSNGGATSPDAELMFTSPRGSNPQTSLPSPASDMSDMYSTVDKSKKLDRRTIHVTGSQNLFHGSNLEEMYAKVLKNKRLSLRQDASSTTGSEMVSSTTKQKMTKLPPVAPLPELPLSAEHRSHSVTLTSVSDTHNDFRRPRSLMSYLDFELVKEGDAIPGPSGDNLGAPVTPPGITLLRRESSTNDPGYEKIRLKKQPPANLELEKRNLQSGDPGYESIRENLFRSLDPDYETLGGRGRNSFNLTGEVQSIHEPNYETVERRKYNGDPCYEKIKPSYEDEEISYETLPQLQPHASGNRSNDPGYETVKAGADGSSKDAELGYEAVGVKLLMENGRNGQYELDPAYESVNFNGYNAIGQRASRNVENGYEKVKLPGFEDEYETDPTYEQVNFRCDDDKSDPGYEQIRLRCAEENGGAGVGDKFVISSEELVGGHDSNELMSSNFEYTSIYYDSNDDVVTGTKQSALPGKFQINDTLLIESNHAEFENEQYLKEVVLETDLVQNGTNVQPNSEITSDRRHHHHRQPLSIHCSDSETFETSRLLEQTYAGRASLSGLDINETTNDFESHQHQHVAHRRQIIANQETTMSPVLIVSDGSPNNRIRIQVPQRIGHSVVHERLNHSSGGLLAATTIDDDVEEEVVNGCLSIDDVFGNAAVEE